MNKSQCNKSKLVQCKLKADRNTSPPLEHNEPVFSMPHFIRVLGSKHYSIFRNYIPSLITYAVCGVIYTVYVTEFKTILQYLPYYNGKYVEQEPAKKSKPAKMNKKEK